MPDLRFTIRDLRFTRADFGASTSMARRKQFQADTASPNPPIRSGADESAAGPSPLFWHVTLLSSPLAAGSRGTAAATIHKFNASRE
jgi:hypothetical protein